MTKVIAVSLVLATVALLAVAANGAPQQALMALATGILAATFWGAS